jgi:hypothetical protein
MVSILRQEVAGEHILDEGGKCEDDLCVSVATRDLTFDVPCEARREKRGLSLFNAESQNRQSHFNIPCNFLHT